jgi:hypothetical protein
MVSKLNDDLISFLNLTDKETISDLIQMMDTFLNLVRRPWKIKYTNMNDHLKFMTLKNRKHPYSI